VCAEGGEEEKSPLNDVAGRGRGEGAPVSAESLRLRENDGDGDMVIAVASVYVKSANGRVVLPLGASLQSR